MKRFFTMLAALMLLSACSLPAENSKSQSNTQDKLTVAAMLFPQYDFARRIAGDRAEVKLLLPAGTESHSYEPTPSDIVTINKCDIFLYTGKEMEPWTETLLDGGLEGDTLVVDLSEGIEMSATESVTYGDDDHGDHGTHDHVLDPHIWTSPKNAAIMAQSICEALCERDREGEDFYRNNLASYLEELDALDEEIRDIVDSGERKEIVFGSRYALHYFSEEYGLTCYAAYDSCSEESEPSAGAVAEIIDLVKEKNIPVIYYEEMTDPKVARAIAQETGAEILLMHSCHNLSKDEMNAGKTYISIMRENAENLRKGLS